MGSDPSPKLAQLLAPLDFPIRGDGSTRIRRLAWRADRPADGSLFFCVRLGRSESTVGAEAVQAGAAALVVSDWLPLAIPQVRVPRMSRAMGPIAAEFYGRPGERMLLIAVTGTNGKTTITYLLESILSHAGLTPGVFGSTGLWLEGELLHPITRTRTMPEAPVVQEWLSELWEGGALSVPLEATSHALDQGRIDGLRFACSIFTNLTHEHLEYHGTMEAYFKAKARLFTPSFTDRSILNADSPESERLQHRDIPATTYGIDREADVRATDVHLTPTGTSFRVGDVELTSPLLGRFNVYNCLAAVAAARALGLEDEHVVEGLRSVRQVPGRLERIEEGQSFKVFVDFAHSPDALTKVLEAVRPMTSGRVLLVSSCSGERNPATRPMIGMIGTTMADMTVITSGSPLSEDPLTIIDEMQAGAVEGRYVVEPDRREAIRRVLHEADPEDTVLIAGRGPMDALYFGDTTIHFDDREVTAEELRRLR